MNFNYEIKISYVDFSISQNILSAAQFSGIFFNLKE